MKHSGHISGRKIGLVSLGCPKNTVDSERLLGELHLRGWEFTDSISEADCIIVNTCGFIEDARLESEEAISEVIQEKDKRPNLILVITGCYPQLDQEGFMTGFPQIDLVTGIGSITEIPEQLENIILSRQAGHLRDEKLIRPGRATLSLSTDPRISLTPFWTAWVKISEGCDHSCAFCTIPYIKGPHRSRSIGDIVREAEIHAADSVKELILISQDTTAYGSDIGTNLRSLLRELDRIDGIDWIRLHYLHPAKISGDLLNTVAESDHVLPYFDIPLQHSESSMLRKMKRLAPDLDPMEIINKIRNRFAANPLPACIRTTLMVGFPGETDDEFRAMLDFVESARIDRLTVFQYSHEQKSPAASFTDLVPDEIAVGRLNELMEAQLDISLEINEGWIGKELDVLLEGLTDDGRRFGRSYRDSPDIDGIVLVDGVPDSAGEGEIIRIRISSALPYDLEGTMLK